MLLTKETDMTKRTPQREAFLTSVIITAIEGGIGYWAVARNYDWGTKEGGQHSLDGAMYARAHVRPQDGFAAVAEPGYPRKTLDDKGRWGILDIDAVAHGLGRLRKDEDNKLCAKSIRKHILGASAVNEGGDIDANDADIIVQVALLGEVVYG